MKRERGLYILITGLLLLAGVAYANSNSEETRSKARYYFMQGSVEASSKNMPEAYEYFKRAYDLDPNYRDAAFTYGGQRLFIQTDTLQSNEELKRSLEMMREYVDSNPKDLYATQMYGYLTTALDTVEESARVYKATYELIPTETQLLQQLADSYMRLMKGKEAISTLEKYETIEGKSKEVSLKKITILLAEQDTLGAIAEADALVRSNPRDPYNMILKGNVYEVVGLPDSVLKAYKEAEALAPSNGAVKMSLAQYYRNTGDSVMLDNMMYEALLSEEFELEDKLGILGDYLQKLIDESGDKARGDHLFSVLLEQYPYEPDVREMSARYAGAKGDYASAAEAVRYAIDMDPSNEQYWLMLLSYELTDSKYADAVKDYESAKEHVEPSLRLKNLYAAGVSMLEDTEESQRRLEELLKETDERLNPVSSTESDREAVRKGLTYDELVWVSSLYCMLGDNQYKKGQVDKAYEEYDKSLFFFGDNALALNNYAYFLSEEGKDLEKAKKMSRRTLDLVENNPTYLDTYAWILYKLGDYREAKEYMELALELAEQQGDDNEEYQKHYEAIKEAVGE
ncbi:MAG: tetratricopeptide repeat protein [Muribaculaceae bacterium]|nr:tetratricopeptide repeat protein [Muribaculaceae bacterium]